MGHYRSPEWKSVWRTHLNRRARAARCLYESLPDMGRAGPSPVQRGGPSRRANGRYLFTVCRMALKIFNTLSGEKEEFVPLKTGEVKMYVCGVSVYDSSHLGHCRFLLSFDVIYRYLRFCGYQVHYVRNFTDVDDKIIKRAQEDNVSCEVITEKYIE